MHHSMRNRVASMLLKIRLRRLCSKYSAVRRAPRSAANAVTTEAIPLVRPLQWTSPFLGEKSVLSVMLWISISKLIV